MIQADTVTREGAEERGGSRKTSVTIPDELLIEAKALTVTQKTSVQDLLISGLRRELAARKVTHSEGGNAAAGLPRPVAKPPAKQS